MGVDFRGRCVSKSVLGFAGLIENTLFNRNLRRYSLFWSSLATTWNLFFWSVVLACSAPQAGRAADARDGKP